MKRIKGFLFSPSETFDASKEDTLGDALYYIMVILAIYAVLIAIIAAIAFSLTRRMLGLFSVPGMPLATATAPMVGVLFFAFALISGIIGIFICGLWLHIWVYLVGGKKGLIQTIKAVIYGETPIFVLGWIPVINIIAGIWALIVGMIGIRQLHELSISKAVIAVILAVITFAIILLALVVAPLVSGTMPGTPLGPGFGGY